MSRNTGVIVSGIRGWEVPYGLCAGTVPVLVCGTGKVNAAVCAYRLASGYGCTMIVNLGVAVGINYDVHPGDVIVADEVMYYDVACGGGNVLGQVDGCPATFIPASAPDFLKDCRHGLVATGDTFVETGTMAAAVTQSLYPEHCPLALDMEAAAIAQVCGNYGAEFISVHLIASNMISGERPADKSRIESEMMAILEKICSNQY